MSARLRSLILTLLFLPFTVFAIGHAHATGAGSAEFEVNGTISAFPAPSGSAPFSGQGTGIGHLTGTSGGSTYEAAFTVLTMPVSGAASTSEPGFPLCGVIGSAAASSWITMGAPSLPGVTGLVYRAGATLTGTVTGLVLSFTFTYERVGVTAALVVSGSATVYYFIPDTGSGSFTSTFTGAGAGAFHIDAVQAASYCVNRTSGPLSFNLTGDVTLAG
jgi:hypothetical protein